MDIIKWKNDEINTLSTVKSINKYDKELSKDKIDLSFMFKWIKKMKRKIRKSQLSQSSSKRKYYDGSSSCESLKNQFLSCKYFIKLRYILSITIIKAIQKC